MKIGKYELYSIETSEFGLDGGAMFGIIPKTLWNKKAPSDAMNRIEMVTRSLLLCSEEKNILIDTGNGTKWEDKYKDIYNINTQKYNIEHSLARHGITTNEITDIICTHLHFDHVGGNTKLESGKIVPTFPNANYWVTKENWELANHPSQKDSGSFMEENWKVLAENQMIKIVNGGEKFIEGVDIYLSYGHTEGLMHPILSDSRNTLFYGADIFPMAAHIPIPWVMAYDVQPVVTMKEKEKLLTKMHNENWILFFEHDPKIQACNIGWNGKQFHMKKEVSISE